MIIKIRDIIKNGITKYVSIIKYDKTLWVRVKDNNWIVI